MFLNIVQTYSQLYCKHGVNILKNLVKSTSNRTTIVKKSQVEPRVPEGGFKLSHDNLLSFLAQSKFTNPQSHYLLCQVRGPELGEVNTFKPKVLKCHPLESNTVIV